MYIYRVLNDCDIALQTKEHGLFNKKVIEEESRICFDIQLMSNNDIQPSEELFKYLLPTYAGVNQFLISKEVKIRQEVLEQKLNLLREINNGDLENYDSDTIMHLELYFKNLFSDINKHIGMGTTYSTKWISFTNSLDKILKYYLTQTKSHQVAVVDSNIKGIFDDNLIALDLSTEKNIEKIKDGLITMSGKYTNLNFRGFKFAKRDNEIIYYNYVPKEKVKAVLTQFEIDILFNNLIDKTFLIENIYPVSYIIKTKLGSEIHRLNNPELYELFNDVYVHNKALSTLVAKYDKSEVELVALKKYILSLLNNVDSNIIKTPQKMLVVPEDYKKNG